MAGRRCRMSKRLANRPNQRAESVTQPIHQHLSPSRIITQMATKKALIISTSDKQVAIANILPSLGFFSPYEKYSKRPESQPRFPPHESPERNLPCPRRPPGRGTAEHDIEYDCQSQLLEVTNRVCRLTKLLTQCRRRSRSAFSSAAT
jgi:hypothetical protein